MLFVGEAVDLSPQDCRWVSSLRMSGTGTQRTQYPLIQEYTLNYNIKATTI